jgi:hypothetical protein
MLVVQKMYRLRLDRFVGVEIIRLGVYRSLIEQNQRKREPDDTSRDESMILNILSASNAFQLPTGVTFRLMALSAAWSSTERATGFPNWIPHSSSGLPSSLAQGLKR